MTEAKEGQFGTSDRSGQQLAKENHSHNYITTAGKKKKQKLKCTLDF